MPERCCTRWRKSEVFLTHWALCIVVRRKLSVSSLEVLVVFGVIEHSRLWASLRRSVGEVWSHRELVSVSLDASWCWCISATSSARVYEPRCLVVLVGFGKQRPAGLATVKSLRWRLAQVHEPAFLTGIGDFSSQRGVGATCSSWVIEPWCYAFGILE